MILANKTNHLLRLMMTSSSHVPAMASSAGARSRAPADGECGHPWHLNFDNKVPRCLPVEEEERNFPRHVPNACFSRIVPAPVDSPRLVVLSAKALQLLDISREASAGQHLVEYFSGNASLPGSETLSHCYCGHQYGLFTGQLGDGANMYLGEVVNQKGERWEVQLKGAGKTPYSRVNTDGRKVLRSSIREFLCSEAMHNLGIPTTRAATCIVTDTMVTRDVQYTNNPIQERATLVVRIARSFLRIGSLEVCKSTDSLTGKAGPSTDNTDLLRRMLDYIIDTFYPNIQISQPREERYVQFFQELISRTARMVAHWQSVGFCHGVINTDNISLVGDTLDYGPFAFMETYDPDHICNASDFWARYSFKRQPEMCKWCLDKMADILQKVAPSVDLQDKLNMFDGEYEQAYLQKMRKKLGLLVEDSSDSEIIAHLLDTMRRTGADFSKVFRCLSRLKLVQSADYAHSMDVTRGCLLRTCCSLEELKHVYRERKYPTSVAIQRSLWVLQTNPEILPQYLQAAIQATDYLNNREMVGLVKNLSESEKGQNDERLWVQWLDSYAERLQTEVPSKAESATVERIGRDRRAMMDTTNPGFVLKNYILQESITKAENNNFDMVNNLLKLVENPFESDSADTHQEEASTPTPDSVEAIQALYRIGPTAEERTAKIT